MVSVARDEDEPYVPGDEGRARFKRLMREEPPLASAPRLLGRLLFSALFAAALAQPTDERSDHERGPTGMR